MSAWSIIFFFSSRWSFSLYSVKSLHLPFWFYFLVLSLPSFYLFCPAFRGSGDIIGDCKVHFLDEIYQLERPGAPALSASDGQFKRMQQTAHTYTNTLWKRWQNMPATIAKEHLQTRVHVYECFLLQGRVGQSVSTARLTLRQSVASAPAVCAAGSRMLTCSCCVTSATWRSTSTASTRRWAPSQMTRTGERERSAAISHNIHHFTINLTMLINGVQYTLKCI